jgi:hypothetical protein
VLEQWLTERLARSWAESVSTVFRWAVTVAPRLPDTVGPHTISTIVKGLASIRGLRPTGRLRQVSKQVRLAIDYAARRALTSTTSAALYVVAVMVGCGWRRADAVRIASGEWEAMEWLSASELAVWPRSEKTDHFGEREIEPSVVLFPDARLARATVERLPCADPDALERAVTALFRTHGVRDVRAARRDAAAATGSRRDAAVLLRHAPNSRTTLRYAGTRDALPRLQTIARRVSFAT